MNNSPIHDEDGGSYIIAFAQFARAARAKYSYLRNPYSGRWFSHDPGREAEVQGDL
jgi:hypothetical protein